MATKKNEDEAQDESPVLEVAPKSGRATKDHGANSTFASRAKAADKRVRNTEAKGK